MLANSLQVKQLCAGSSPKQFAFWINKRKILCPLSKSYWGLATLSNDLEASKGNAERLISLAPTLVTSFSKYASKRLESCTSRWRKQSLTRITHQADRSWRRRKKLKKFLCSNCLLELVGFYCKRRQRIVLSERRIRPKPNNTLSEKFVCQESALLVP